MKKLVLFLIILFGCFGCTAKYELKFNKDLSVDESVIGLENVDFYSKFDSSKSEVIDLVLAPYRSYLYNYTFQIDEYSEGDQFGAKALRHFNNIDDYYNNFDFYKAYFKNFSLTNSDGIISISLTDKITDDSFSNRFIIDDGEISIVVPFEVVKHNADRVDEKNHKYTWKFDLTDSTKKNILIEFDSNKIAKTSNHDYLIFLIYLLGFVAFGYFIFVLFKTKQKNRNDI